MLRVEYTAKFGHIRQHAVSALYHDEGYTLREIGQMLGIGVARAQQLVSGITPALRKKWERSAASKV
jgi:DNA-directed RNA polymerase specialized sigma subunit